MLSQVIKKTVRIPVQNQGFFKSCYKGGQCKRRLRTIVFTMQIWNEYVTTILYHCFRTLKTIVRSQSEVGPQSAFYTPLTKVRFN